MDIYQVSVGSYVQNLQGMCGVLDKAATHLQEQGRSLDDILAQRLFEDMFDLRWQLIAVAHHSKGAIDGLKSGKFAPPDFSQDLDYAGCQALLADALGELQGASADEINSLADGRVIFSLGGNEIPFTAENFILSFSLPNFYFHSTTAYDILRAAGVPVGKRDYLGPMRIG